MKKRGLDTFRDEYLNPTPDRVVDQKVVRLLAEHVIKRLKGRSALELGVGDQIWTPMLVQKFAHVTTLDGSSDLLAAMKARIRSKRWNPVHTFFEEYKPLRRFDIVLITFVLEHVDDPLLILRMARQNWLRKGGTLAVAVPHALSLHRRLAVAMGLIQTPQELGTTDHRMGHLRCFTYTEMQVLLQKAGFTRIISQGAFTKAFPNGQLTACTDAQLRGLFKLGLHLPIEYSGTIYFEAR